MKKKKNRNPKLENEITFFPFAYSENRQSPPMRCSSRNIDRRRKCFGSTWNPRPWQTLCMAGRPASNSRIPISTRGFTHSTHTGEHASNSPAFYFILQFLVSVFGLLRNLHPLILPLSSSLFPPSFLFPFLLHSSLFFPSLSSSTFLLILFLLYLLPFLPFPLLSTFSTFFSFLSLHFLLHLPPPLLFFLHLFLSLPFLLASPPPSFHLRHKTLPFLPANDRQNPTPLPFSKVFP